MKDGGDMRLHGESAVVAAPDEIRYNALDIPLSSYIELMSDDGLESIEGFRKVLRTFSPDDAEKLESESPVTVTGMLKVYGEVFSKVQGAALGE